MVVLARSKCARSMGGATGRCAIGAVSASLQSSYKDDCARIIPPYGTVPAVLLQNSSNANRFSFSVSAASPCHRLSASSLGSSRSHLENGVTCEYT